MQIARRSFLFGAGASLVAAPAIVRAASLMPVKAPRLLTQWQIVLREIDLIGREPVPSQIWGDLGTFGNATFSLEPGALNFVRLPPGTLLACHPII